MYPPDLKIAAAIAHTTCTKLVHRPNPVQKSITKIYTGGHIILLNLDTIKQIHDELVILNANLYSTINKFDLLPYKRREQ